MNFKTLAIHAGHNPREHQGAVMTPIYQTSTFAFRGVGEPGPFDYSRSGNPTRQALESCLAQLEGGTAGFAFATGMAAEATVLMMYSAGDTVVVHDDLYGGTYRLFESVFASKQIRAHYVDLRNAAKLDAALAAGAKAVWLESPTNPLMNLVDIRAVSDLAHQHGARVICDNTFLSPYFQRPLDLGADIVTHSTTKYINGHSDVVGGAVVVKDPEPRRRRSAFSRTPWALAPARRIASWFCAGSKRWPCVWRSTTATRSPSHNGWRSIPRWRPSCTPGSKAILSTNWRYARPRDRGEHFPSACAAVKRR